MKLSLNNVNKSFSEKEIIKDFSFDFPNNGIFCITGPSGKGKTTLLRLIAGLEKPDSGTIIKDGKLAFHFQEDRLLPWLTAEENISIVSSKKEAESILKAVELFDDKDKLPGELSGGMCRRISLARALSFNADIILLDEPFKGLDDELKQKIMKYIKEISKEKLIIMVTHDKAEIDMLADKIIAI